jgi:hypothetical protein
MSAWLVVCLVVGAAVAGGVARRGRRRRRSSGADDTFRCTIRAVGDGRWSRPRRARWAHDVLIVRPGAVLGRTRVLATVAAHGEVGPMPSIRHEPWVTIRLQLDDASLVEVAAPSYAADALAGPFLAAHAALR